MVNVSSPSVTMLVTSVILSGLIETAPPRLEWDKASIKMVTRGRKGCREKANLVKYPMSRVTRFAFFSVNARYPAIMKSAHVPQRFS